MDVACIKKYIGDNGDETVAFRQYGTEAHPESHSQTNRPAVDDAADAYGQTQSKAKDEVQKIERTLPLSGFFEKYKEISAAFFEHRELAH